MKKAVGLLTDPFLVATALLVVGLLLVVLRADRRWRGAVVVLFATAILLLSALWPVASLLTVPLEDDYAAVTVTAELREVRYVAVLGGGHTATAGRPRVQWLNRSALERQVEGVRLVHALDEPYLIVSGWAGRGVAPHADVAAESAVSLGVPADRIIRLPDPRDTAEELAAIAEVVGSEPFLLVTSASHMPRAMAAADRRGLRAIPAPTDFRARVPRGIWAWMPDPEALDVTTAAIHEYVGRLGYRLIDR